MSRQFSSGNFIDNIGASYTYPWSTAVWAIADSGSVEQCAASLGDSTTNNSRGRLVVQSNDTLHTHQRVGGSTNDVGTTNTITAGVWQHFFETVQDGSIEVMLNGDTGNVGSATPAAIGISGWDRTLIGASVQRETEQLPWTGLIAWRVRWDTNLTLDEGVEMAQGRHPLTVRPANIQTCVPVWGEHSPEIDLVSGFGTFTVTGTPTADVEQPPMELWTPTRRVFSVDPAPAAPATAIKDVILSQGVIPFAR